MTASERLRALAARFENDYYAAADASAHALPLIADYLALVESWRFCPECRYAMENHPTGCALGQVQKALAEELES